MAWDPIRQWREQRPLTLMAACLLLGMVMGLNGAVSWRIWASGAAAMAVLGFIRRRGVFLYTLILLGGAALIAFQLVRPVTAPAERGELTGRVAGEPVQREEYTRFLLDDVTVDGEPLPCRVMVYLYDEQAEALRYGDVISLEASIFSPSDAGNPHGFDYSAWLWREGALLTASANSVTLLEEAPFSLRGLSLQCRGRLRSAIEEVYDPESVPLLCTLLLGERDQMPEDLRDSFRRAGLAHVLAISGLHISCLAWALDRLLRALRCPGKVSFVLVGLLMVCYAGLVGFPASVVRAVLMFLFAGMARLFGRPSDGLNGLSAAMIVILLLRPLDVSNPSFILSFSSVAGILLLTRPLSGAGQAFLGKGRWLAQKYLQRPLAASLAAQLGALPATACLFGALPTYSVLANLPVLPAITLLLPIAMVSLVLGLFFPAAAWPLSRLVQLLLNGLTGFAEWIAQLPGAMVDTPIWPVGLILLYAALCLTATTISAARYWIRRLCLLLLPAVAAAALMLPLAQPSSGLEILFLDVGQGDAALIHAGDRYYLMDVGEGDETADYLRSSGIRPDAVFLSHPHADHAGGMIGILELCSPSTLYVPCLWEDVPADGSVSGLLDQARAAGWQVETLEAGDRLSLSEQVEARVIQPWPGMTEDANGASLVMQVTCGAGSALFTGDLDMENEYAFFPDSDVLKVAHHGAASSTSSLFLKMVSPSVAVISVGRNHYGHPSGAVLERLAGSAVFRTDQCGAISVRIQPDGSVQVTPTRVQTEQEEAA